jgi:peptidyl-prolyl cis-trans isomerase C
MFALLSRRLVSWTGAAMVAVLVLAGVAAAQEDKVVANVNGQPITEAELVLAETELDPQFAQLPPDQKRAAALSAMIEIRLMAAESEKAGVPDDSEFKRRMEFLRLRALHSQFVSDKVANAVTDEAIRARYDQEIAAQPAVNEIRASHILVDTEEKAREIIAKLEAGSDFAELAKENSSDGSAAGGGDLGYFGPGRMVPEFEQAAMALEVGQHSKEPVKSQFGFHVIKVTDKRPQQPPAFEQVQSQIRSLMLREKYFEQAAALRGAAQVDINDPTLKAAVEAIDKPAEQPKK